MLRPVYGVLCTQQPFCVASNAVNLRFPHSTGCFCVQEKKNKSHSCVQSFNLVHFSLFDDDEKIL